MINLKRRHALALLALAGSLLAHGATAAEEKILNVYNWAEYIGETTVKDFEKETGIKVRYDNFDSNESLFVKMVAGRSGYDIVVPSSDFGRMMIDAGVVRPLDRSLLPQWQHLNPRVMQLMERLDPGNRHLVPWLGGTVAVGYNVDKVRAALGGEAIPANPFELVFNPKYTRRLKACGIAMLDSASDVFPSALIYLGKPAYSGQAADYQAAANLLQQVRGDVAVFSFNGYIQDLASGQLCVALGYGGDFNNAARQARQAGNGVQIEAPLPPGGAQFGFEAMLIPADAPHPENAHRWINFILRPEVQAEIANRVMFTTPNLSAKRLMKPEVLANPIANPPDDYLAS
ncbi:extracellular solute-binding protein [Ideonella sp.]|uniref:extracellular solute-binding protein n=1 Tax=Ideonella sp. TaxID=1929293 RepID=UPI003BB4C38E